MGKAKARLQSMRPLDYAKLVGKSKAWICRQLSAKQNLDGVSSAQRVAEPGKVGKWLMQVQTRFINKKLKEKENEHGKQ